MGLERGRAINTASLGRQTEKVEKKEKEEAERSLAGVGYCWATALCRCESQMLEARATDWKSVVRGFLALTILLAFPCCQNGTS